MKATPWINVVLLAILLVAGAAMAEGKRVEEKPLLSSGATGLGKNSDVMAATGGKEDCPVSEMKQSSLHKSGEPCPYMKDAEKMHDGCDMRGKKKCLEKRGEPCLGRHDKRHESMPRDACDLKKKELDQAK